MTQKRPTLGRGLADLLGQARIPAFAPGPDTVAPGTGAAAEAAQAPGPSRAGGRDEFERLPLDLLQPGRYQPRTDMRPESLAALAESIRAQGVVQPIVVRPIGAPDAHGTQRYEIIAGERRWRAAQQAGLHEIPAVVRHVADDAAIAMALIENIQREDLNPLEEARALQRLISEFGLTHQQAAQAVGRSRAAVSNLLRLLELPEEVCAQVERRELEMGHARALLGLPQRRQQTEVAALVARKSLSVRETESLVRRMIEPSRSSAGEPATVAVDPNIARLEDELAEKLGARVAIEHARAGHGRVVIRYNNLDELDGILSHFQPAS
ncbi:MAG TPA: ParB/RepB/Spo0J family partition protein [Steroidobacteraceae bacterium]|jgi:ParB family chromosome partitioning protein|nr:ParB/RepB/Spo0J family partition protein [Steroidobacteraceae bacterium]